MALAKTEAQDQAVAEVFDGLVEKKTAIVAEITSAKAMVVSVTKPEDGVEAALAVLLHLPQLAAEQNDLVALGEALRSVNMRRYLGKRGYSICSKV